MAVAAADEDDVPQDGLIGGLQRKCDLDGTAKRGAGQNSTAAAQTGRPFQT